MFNEAKGENYHEYYNAYHSHRRVVFSVRRGRRLLLEETTVDVTSRIILTQKQSLIKQKGDNNL
jgi:hypothetical protein